MSDSSAVSTSDATAPQAPSDAMLKKSISLLIWEWLIFKELCQNSRWPAAAVAFHWENCNASPTNENVGCPACNGHSIVGIGPHLASITIADIAKSGKNVNLKIVTSSELLAVSDGVGYLDANCENAP